MGHGRAELKPLSDITDPRIVKALGHPLRVRILGALEARTASPRELAEELGAPLPNVSYHVRQLASLGLLKLVKETPRRGVVEHYYRLERRPRITDRAWGQAPAIVKEAVLGAVLGQVSEHVNAAASTGGFDRADTHISRLPLTLDEAGFRAVSRELGALVKRLKQIEVASSKRLAKGDHQGEMSGLAVLMLCESGEPAPLRRPSSRAGARAVEEPESARA